MHWMVWYPPATPLPWLTHFLPPSSAVRWAQLGLYCCQQTQTSRSLQRVVLRPSFYTLKCLSVFLRNSPALAGQTAPADLPGEGAVFLCFWRRYSMTTPELVKECEPIVRSVSRRSMSVNMLASCVSTGLWQAVLFILYVAATKYLTKTTQGQRAYCGSELELQCIMAGKL